MCALPGHVAVAAIGQETMNPYFSGTYLHTIDERGRVALPAKLREKLGDAIAITNGRGKCLVVYPEKVWNAMAEKVISAPDLNAGEDNMRLFLFGDAWEGEIDKQGRVPIPDYLRDAATLGADVAVVGAGDHVQIWDKEAWIAKRAELHKSPPTLASVRAVEKTAE